jgi:exodeoxyribonuclease VIII
VTATINKAEHRPMTSAEYHAHPALGASMLETFRESRRKFYGQHVAQTMPPREPTDAMKLGTLVHLRLLEPERFPEAVADPYPEVAPDGKNWLRRKGSDHEAWWQEEVNKRLGKIAAEKHTLDLVEAVVAAVKANDRANWLLSQQGESEFPIFWTDPDTGLPCKIMVDWFAAISLDLKTAYDPSPAAYAKSLVGLGYHRKLAHYKCGLSHYCGENAEFVHIAAGTTAPHCVACYEVDDRDRQGFNLGAAQRRRMLYELAECYRTNDWREPWEKSVVTLQLPAWAFQEDSYQY